MKIRILTILLLITGMATFGQINMADSTVQVITYWEQGEKQNYSVVTGSIKIKDSDTTSREITTYDVEITVLQADDKSYTVEWYYKNFKTDSQNVPVQKIMSIAKDIKVVYRTDELGIFVEVVNWKEIRDYIHNVMDVMQKDSRLSRCSV